MQVRQLCRLLLIGVLVPKRAVGMASVTCRYHVGAQRSVYFDDVNQLLSECPHGVQQVGLTRGAVSMPSLRTNLPSSMER